MGFVKDLRYFAATLSPGEARRLALQKFRKREQKRALAGRFATPESEAMLLERLGLPAETSRRLDLWRELCEPLAASEVLVPAYDSTAAHRVLDGVQSLFGQEVRVGWPPSWNWRWEGTENANVFARDVRSTWELQRLQGILPLGTAARAASGPERERYAEAYLSAVVSFASAHPGPYGIAWSSALELGLRILALVQGIPLVSGTEVFARAEMSVLRLLDRHVRWLAVDLSLDKVVRGNHLLGELSGLLAAGCLVPSARMSWWGELAVPSLLEAEVLRQFHEDGVSVEQSLTYEKFVLEFLTAAGEMTCLRGEPLSSAVQARLALAARHLEIVTAPDGTLPRVGDCDSGRGTGDGEDPHRPSRSIASARRVFPSDAPPSGLGRYHFERGGHVVLAPEPGDFLFVRGGPFGWGRPGPASHSHADWLAPVLYLDREPILIDPGVFGYDVGARLRDAFRGWEAHNAILPGTGRGPEPAGLFRWRGLDARAEITLGDAWEVKGRVMWPNPPPLLWHRSIGYNQLHRGWRLEDRLEGAGSDPVTCGMHFAPGIEVEAGKSGEFGLVLRSGKSFRLRLDPVVDTEIRKGWAAPAYGRREPNLVLTYILRPNQTGVTAEIVLL